MLEQLKQAAGAFNKSVQFYHDKKGDRTYAVEVNFNKEDLLESVHQFDNDIELNVGISYVNPKDLYCKKIGRVVSSTRLGIRKFKFNALHNEGEKIYLTLADKELVLHFRLNKNSDKPHFIAVSQNYVFDY